MKFFSITLTTYPTLIWYFILIKIRLSIMIRIFGCEMVGHKLSRLKIMLNKCEIKLNLMLNSLKKYKEVIDLYCAKI